MSPSSEYWVPARAHSAVEDARERAYGASGTTAERRFLLPQIRTTININPRFTRDVQIRRGNAARDLGDHSCIIDARLLQSRLS